MTSGPNTYGPSKVPPHPEYNTVQGTSFNDSRFDRIQQLNLEIKGALSEAIALAYRKADELLGNVPPENSKEAAESPTPVNFLDRVIADQQDHINNLNKLLCRLNDI